MAPSYSTANPRRRFAAAKATHWQVQVRLASVANRKGPQTGSFDQKQQDLRPAAVRLLKFLPYQIWGPNCP